MADAPNDLRSQLTSLMRKRQETEAEILNLRSHLEEHGVGMDEKLVDEEGYPRNDVDIYAIRTLRHSLICKTNDCTDLTKQIEQRLYELHSQERVTSTPFDRSEESTRLKPFARVDIVDENSPAQKADLHVGDLVIKFDAITSKNFQGLSSLATIVGANVEKPLRINVLRENEVVPLILVPKQWSGPGFLGCKLLPV